MRLLFCSMTVGSRIVSNINDDGIQNDLDNILQLSFWQGREIKTVEQVLISCETLDDIKTAIQNLEISDTNKQKIINHAGQIIRKLEAAAVPAADAQKYDLTETQAKDVLQAWNAQKLGGAEGVNNLDELDQALKKLGIAGGLEAVRNAAKSSGRDINSALKDILANLARIASNPEMRELFTAAIKLLDDDSYILNLLGGVSLENAAALKNTINEHILKNSDLANRIVLNATVRPELRPLARDFFGLNLNTNHTQRVLLDIVGSKNVSAPAMERALRGDFSLLKNEIGLTKKQGVLLQDALEADFNQAVIDGDAEKLKWLQQINAGLIELGRKENWGADFIIRGEKLGQAIDGALHTLAAPAPKSAPSDSGHAISSVGGGADTQDTEKPLAAAIDDILKSAQAARGRLQSLQDKARDEFNEIERTEQEKKEFNQALEKTRTAVLEFLAEIEQQAGVNREAAAKLEEAIAQLQNSPPVDENKLKTLNVALDNLVKSTKNLGNLDAEAVAFIKNSLFSTAEASKDALANLDKQINAIRLATSAASGSIGDALVAFAMIPLLLNSDVKNIEKFPEIYLPWIHKIAAEKALEILQEIHGENFKAEEHTKELNAETKKQEIKMLTPFVQIIFQGFANQAKADHKQKAKQQGGLTALSVHNEQISREPDIRLAYPALLKNMTEADKQLLTETMANAVFSLSAEDALALLDNLSELPPRARKAVTKKLEKLLKTPAGLQQLARYFSKLS
ncbi:MAG: hypothetical protein LBD99_00530, partial [Candidatus Margulisbacteria bacterium]|nr:hypothetical protein [Candidatus Margulisiibacteriota bacterium]